MPSRPVFRVAVDSTMAMRFHYSVADCKVKVLEMRDMYMGRVAELVASEAIYETGIGEQADACFAALRCVQSQSATCWTLEDN